MSCPAGLKWMRLRRRFVFAPFGQVFIWCVCVTTLEIEPDPVGFPREVALHMSVVTES